MSLRHLNLKIKGKIKMSNKIKIENVRLSFPSLFKKAQYNGQETKFEATFLLCKDEHADLIKKIDAIIDEEAKEAKIKRPSSDRVCLRDGDEFDYDGYENTYALKASSNRRPTVVDKDKTPLAEEDGVLYSGCYVNAIVDFWVMNNKYGKRVNCNLLGVQFAKDGDSFGAGATDVTDEFEDLDDL